MDVVKGIIEGLHPDEVRRFRTAAHNGDSAHVAQDLQLFNLIRGQNETDDAQLAASLGFADNKNSYYQIKNRLKKRLENFILTQLFEDESIPIIAIIHLLSLSKHLFQKNRNEEGWYYLHKAEMKATAAEEYEMLNIIHHTQLDNAHKIPHTDVSEIIEKRKLNLKLAKRMGNLNAEYARIRDHLMKTQFTEKDDETLKSLENVFNDSALLRVQEVKNSFNLQYKLMSVVGDVMRFKKRPDALAVYFKRRYRELESHGLFNKHNHDKKLTILYRIAVGMLRGRKFPEAYEYLEKFKKELPLYDNAFYDLFIDYYNQLAAAYYSYVGKIREAIQLSEDALKTSSHKLRHDVEYLFRLNLSIFYFCNRDFKKASKLITDLLDDKRFKHLFDESMELANRIFEAIIFHEQNNPIYSEKLCKYIKRHFKTLLADKRFSREAEFINFLIRINNKPYRFTDKKFIAEVKTFMKQKPVIEIGDREHANFNAWLTAKIEKRNYYDVLLEMVNSK